MKIALLCVASIIVLIGSVALIGAMLPQRHIASRSASFHAPPERLFALISDPQDWRPRCAHASSLVRTDGVISARHPGAAKRPTCPIGRQMEFPGQ